jgi:hypothetical protein
MAKIAKAAGISKAPPTTTSVRRRIAATLEQAAADKPRRRSRTRACSRSSSSRSLEAYLGWVERHAGAYEKPITSVGAVPEVREIVERIRNETAERILAASRQRSRATVARCGPRVDVSGRRDPRLARAPRHRSRQAAWPLLGTPLGAVTASGEPLNR